MFEDNKGEYSLTMPYCIAKYCHVSDRNNPRKAGFHVLPSGRGKSQLRRQWLSKCGRPEVNDKQARVCSEHFRREDFVNILQYESGYADRLLLKPDSVPSIFGQPDSVDDDAPVPSTSRSQTEREARTASRCKKRVS